MSPRFRPGDTVRVRTWDPPGHVRTPFYTRGRRGVVLALAAVHPNPEELAYGRSGLPAQPVYRVAFSHAELWGPAAERAGDRTVADLQERWLEAAP
jgi:nitrile hydratase